MSIFTHLANFCLDFIYPTYCCGCQKLGPYLCQKCQEKLEFLFLPIPLKLNTQYLDDVWSATTYALPTTNLIHSMKYQHVKGIAQFCAQLLYFTTNIPPTDVITAPPLHADRLDERGFNQSAEIAKTLSQLTHVPYLELLEKKRATAPQASLTRSEDRTTNLDHAFAIKKTVKKFPNSVLLIDDVLTTGTTLNTCAKILKEHGCSHVYGLTIAHGS